MVRLQLYVLIRDVTEGLGGNVEDFQISNCSVTFSSLVIAALDTVIDS